MPAFRTAAAALALAAIVPLGACDSGDDEAVTTGDGQVSRTLAAAIGDAPHLSTVSDALSDAGLAGVLDGPGSYTVLAPTDAAFAKLGGEADELTSGEVRPVLVAVLRDHILPGHLTPEAIREAVEDQGGPVKVRTLGEGAVTFSTDGDRITVAGDEGMRATVDGEALVASNGVVIPLDGLLKAPDPQPRQ